MKILWRILSFVFGILGLVEQILLFPLSVVCYICAYNGRIRWSTARRFAFHYPITYLIVFFSYKAYGRGRFISLERYLDYIIYNFTIDLNK